ncbi:RNA pyrophosphohydrolase [Acidihalobacter yilgarnensis]|uniref:RNA pyrophosphohydrolase n=1 Tax=Acidihalobacter yilgarnensis TaxID=2819280 RepID=UPI0018D359C4|nr:RNA pyrophosphohydrolase [Acidihalobacter yilgarnensis]
MIDSDGFRHNVGIILSNAEGRVFWGKRIGQCAWQFPQGGIRADESPEQAMYRELWEETGLEARHVSLVGRTRGWLRYRLPKNLVRRHASPRCIGQKQVWFLLSLDCDESCFDLAASTKPEFDGWRWVDYWQPMEEVVFFKRKVYRRALNELSPLLFGTETDEPLPLLVQGPARRVS